MKSLPACLLAIITVAMTAAASSAEEKGAAVLNHKVKSIKGDEVDLGKYKGKVLLVVNVASRCGNTSQYTQLEELNKKYKDKGLSVLGFPCNQFLGQEPESEEKIAEFCKSKYNVTFDLFSKIEVNGPGADPFYKDLTSKETDPNFSGKITWNFEKFLIGRDGKVVGRFKPGTSPDAAEIVKAIETELAKPE